jgi:hypothetical protein
MRRGLLILGAFAILTVSASAARACPYTTAVQGWYQQYLHRPLDPLGAQVWVNQLRSGAPPGTVLAGILGSDEYYRRCGGNEAAFVTGLYTDLVGRPPCAQDLANWCGRMRRVGCRVTFSQQFIGDCCSRGMYHLPALPAAVPPTPLAPAPVPQPGYFPPVPLAPAPNPQVGFAPTPRVGFAPTPRVGFAPTLRIGFSLTPRRGCRPPVRAPYPIPGYAAGYRGHHHHRH